METFEAGIQCPWTGHVFRTQEPGMKCCNSNCSVTMTVSAWEEKQYCLSCRSTQASLAIATDRQQKIRFSSIKTPSNSDVSDLRGNSALGSGSLRAGATTRAQSLEEHRYNSHLAALKPMLLLSAALGGIVLLFHLIVRPTLVPQAPSVSSDPKPSTVRSIAVKEVNLIHSLKVINDFRLEAEATAISDNGRTLARFIGGKAEVLSLPMGTPIVTYENGRSIASLAVNVDGTLMVTATGSGTIDVWDPQTGTHYYTLEKGDGLGETKLDLNSDGTILVVGKSDGRIRIWDLKSKELLRSFSLPSRELYSVAISPNNKLLASGGEDEVNIWDLQTGNLLYSLTENLTPTAKFFNTTALAFSDDSQLLITGGYDGVLRIWNLSTGQVRLQILNAQSRIGAVTFSQDKNVIAAGGESGSSVRFWDANTGEEIYSLQREWCVTRFGKQSLMFIDERQEFVSNDACGTSIWQIKLQ